MRIFCTTVGKTPENSFHLMRPADDGNLPWTGVIFGLTISSIWYWCSDQVGFRAYIWSFVSAVRDSCLLGERIVWFTTLGIQVISNIIRLVTFKYSLNSALLCAIFHGGDIPKLSSIGLKMPTKYDLEVHWKFLLSENLCDQNQNMWNTDCT